MGVQQSHSVQFGYSQRINQSEKDSFSASVSVSGLDVDIEERKRAKVAAHYFT